MVANGTCETVRAGVRCSRPQEFLTVFYCKCGQHGPVETYANCREHARDNIEHSNAAGDSHDTFVL